MVAVLLVGAAVAAGFLVGAAVAAGFPHFLFLFVIKINLKNSSFALSLIL